MGHRTSNGAGSIAAEFAGAELGDSRRGPRLTRIAERLGSAPGESFPKLFPDSSELEALYRFLGNDKVDWRQVLEPHSRATVERCRQRAVVRIAHDTTDFVFAGEREGLGTVMQRTKGFFLHAALAVSGDEEPMALGMLSMLPYVRIRERGMKALNEWKREARARPRIEKESSRWERLVLEASARLPPEVHAIHVMDQEADDFTLLVLLCEARLNFVVRGSASRQVAGNQSGPLQAELNKFEGETFRTVRLSVRTPKQAHRNRKSHPARQERMAELQIRWGELLLRKPQHAQTKQEELRLAVVQVFEPNPPEGEEPVSWTLFTSEPVVTAEQAAMVVDHYRCRWIIEEFFKTLKTGCAFQERQITTLAGLVRALAVTVPVAWHMLMLRTLGRQEKSPPATTLFLPKQLILLGALLRQAVRKDLPPNPTVRDAMLAIAKLGGHITQNGDPGWLVIGRGMQEFLRAQHVLAAMAPLKL